MKKYKNLYQNPFITMMMILILKIAQQLREIIKHYMIP